MRHERSRDNCTEWDTERVPIVIRSEGSKLMLNKNQSKNYCLINNDIYTSIYKARSQLTSNKENPPITPPSGSKTPGITEGGREERACDRQAILAAPHAHIVVTEVKVHRRDTYKDNR